MERQPGSEVIEPKEPINTVDAGRLGEVLSLVEEESSMVRNQMTLPISARLLEGPLWT